MDLTTSLHGPRRSRTRSSPRPRPSPRTSIRSGASRTTGPARVVMFSLFEEQIRHDRDAMEHFMGLGTESFGEALSYFPEVDDYDVGPAQYPGAHSQGERRGRHPDHRQPERRDGAGMGGLRQGHAGCRRQGASS